MSSNLDSISTVRPALDVGLPQVLSVLWASLARRKLLVGGTIACAIALGGLAILIIPRSYTATAYVRGGFVVSSAVAEDADKKGGPYVGLDLTRMIETQSRLLQSEDLARRVVQQFGLEKLKSELDEQPASTQDDASGQDNAIDQAAVELLDHLTVTSDQLRTYMIKVIYTGQDRALAVAVTNAFVAEFLRSSKLQVLAQQRSAAQDAVLNDLNKFGEKHPSVIQARVRLANADAQLKQQLNEEPERLLRDGRENITLASVNTSTSSPHPLLVIGLLTILGLMTGITAALILERKHWAEAFSRYLRPFA